VTYRLADLRSALDALPRVRLAYVPTPLRRLDTLSRELGVELWIKRDDLTGLALGGNKVRKLEFLLGQARAMQADTLITTGSSQSNHARMTAAAARALGLECYLVLEEGRHPQNGNLLLDRLLGAHVEHVPDAGSCAGRMEELADELHARGRAPMVIPLGGSSAYGALGYVAGFAELLEQIESAGLSPDAVYLATSSCGTQTGVLAAAVSVGAGIEVRGVSVSHASSVQQDTVRGLSLDVLRLLGMPTEISTGAVHVDDNHIGPGYGHPTAAMWSALKRTAQTEGILLDPVYTGKAMAGLLHDVEAGVIARGATAIFLHTGGTPALFAYADELEAAIG
jgi:L-cysteate sulfo-lyase